MSTVGREAAKKSSSTFDLILIFRLKYEQNKKKVKTKVFFFSGPAIYLSFSLARGGTTLSGNFVNKANKKISSHNFRWSQFADFFGKRPKVIKRVYFFSKKVPLWG